MRAKYHNEYSILDILYILAYYCPFYAFVHLSISRECMKIRIMHEKCSNTFEQDYQVRSSSKSVESKRISTFSYMLHFFPPNQNIKHSHLILAITAILCRIEVKDEREESRFGIVTTHNGISRSNRFEPLFSIQLDR